MLDRQAYATKPHSTIVPMRKSQYFMFKWFLRFIHDMTIPYFYPLNQQSLIHYLLLHAFHFFIVRLKEEFNSVHGFHVCRYTFNN